MATLAELARLGQAVWLDYMRRGILDSGEFKGLVDAGLTGVTSNPTIFDKAIAGSADYDDDLKKLVREGRSIEEIYEILTVEDIQRAADLLRPAFDRTGGADGFASLEVSPKLAGDTQGTIAEARRLFAELKRPNVMIKVPATAAGIPAIEALTGEGINVNITLMFSMAHYEAVAEAYLKGLEKLAAAGKDLSKVHSVASFFVSRVDTMVDHELEKVGDKSLLGKIGIANSKVVYRRFRQVFSGPRWEALAAKGARVQRPLWASTSTKNPAYPDTMYADGLIGPDTINTMPPATITAFQDHGTVALTLEVNLDEAGAQLAHLAELGISLDAITEQLQVDGVAAFDKSLDALLASIEKKRSELQSEWQKRSGGLGKGQSAVDRALEEMKEKKVVARIWSHDYTVWKPEPAEITNRLGWLHVAEAMKEHLPHLKAFVDSVVADGYSHALLLGMGGSSLAPEVLGKVFGGQAMSLLHLSVLDTTDPAAVLAHSECLDPAHTLLIVSTKSGTTVETLSAFKYFYNWASEKLGADAGRHFVAITDPGSPLVDLAQHYGFRETFLNDPNIGGRYSALSYFGLVPAALVGVDVELLLDRALAMASNCEPSNVAIHGHNHGAWLGALLGESAKAGRDKVTFVTSPAIDSFGDWVEQLIAESTGKEGKGILPVVGEPLGVPGVYGNDRLFVYLRLGDDSSHDKPLKALESAGHPVIRLHLRDLYDLGEQFFLWEMAVAVAGYRLGINPFDQPNVEASKILARKMVAAYTSSGTLPADPPAALSGQALSHFIAQARPGDYVALQAYVEPTAEADLALLGLRLRLRDTLKLATTVGYGPRFLHSTGQLHKGDGGHGLFIQLTADDHRDLPVPDEAGQAKSSISFGVLKMAQALGDEQALRDAGRRVIRFHLGGSVAEGLNVLGQGLS